jgi:hypothetical protein
VQASRSGIEWCRCCCRCGRRRCWRRSCHLMRQERKEAKIKKNRAAPFIWRRIFNSAFVGFWNPEFFLGTRLSNSLFFEEFAYSSKPIWIILLQTLHGARCNLYLSGDIKNEVFLQCISPRRLHKVSKQRLVGEDSKTMIHRRKTDILCTIR